MRLQKQRLLCLALLLCLIGQVWPALAQDGGAGSVPAQGLAQVGGLGGLTRAMIALDGGGVLLAEGDALVHLDPAGAVLNRAVLGRGQILRWVHAVRRPRDELSDRYDRAGCAHVADWHQPQAAGLQRPSAGCFKR